MCFVASDRGFSVFIFYYFCILIYVLFSCHEILMGHFWKCFYNKVPSSCLSGGSYQADSSSSARVSHSVHGHHHGGVLPDLLDAIRRCCHDGHLWPARTHQPCCQRHPFNPCQDQHRHQPCDLHPHEQTGECWTELLSGSNRA